MKHLFFLLLLASAIVSAQSFSVEVEDSSSSIINKFPSLQEAYNSLPDSAGNYIIEILPIYNSSLEHYPIVFNHKNIKNLTIRPAAGNNDCVISADTNTAVMKFDSCSNVVIDGRPGGIGDTVGLKIENRSILSDAYSVSIENGSTDLLFRYLQVFNSTQSDTFGRNISIGWSANKNITIENSVIDGGRFGVISKGNPDRPNEKITVRNNTIRSYGFCGVKIFYGTLSMTVYNNDIYMTHGYNVYIPVGVSISGTARGVDSVVNNRIHDIQTTAASGISMRGIYCYQSPSAKVNIINNFISLSHTVPGSCNDVYGIVMMGPNDFSANILYNTIYIAGTENGGSAGHVVSAGIMKFNNNISANFTMMNNIIINKRTGGRTGVIHAASVLQNNSVNRTIDYNTYYCSEGAGHYTVGWESLLYNDLSQYQLASGAEDSSNFHEVRFISDSDLHLDPSFRGDPKLVAASISGVEYDIDGDHRSLTSPYRGADELGDFVPVELVSFNASLNGSDVVINWTTVSEKNNYGFEIDRSRSNGEWENLGFVKGSGTTTNEMKYSYTDKTPAPGTYTYRLKQIDLDGTYEYVSSAEVEVLSPGVYSLSQNYPNPFNPSTVIKYTIIKAGNVNLKLFDILGNEIGDLVNEYEQPGTYEVQFSAKGLAAGVYLYRMNSGDFSYTRKMILLK